MPWCANDTFFNLGVRAGFKLSWTLPNYFVTDIDWLLQAKFIGNSLTLQATYGVAIEIYGFWLSFKNA